jgi:hypothetical protein
MARLAITTAVVPFEAPCPYAGRMIEQTGELKDEYTGVSFLEAAGTQAFKAGDLVGLVAGLVTGMTDGEATAPTPATGANEIYGIALTNATGTTGAEIRVLPINSHTIYEMNLVSTTAGTTNPPDVTALIGQWKNVRAVTATDANSAVTYGFGVSSDVTSLQRVRIVGLCIKPTIPIATATYTRVLVVFTPLACNGTTTFYNNLQVDL